MKRTLATLKTIVDGLAMYASWYLWTALVIYFGFMLLGFSVTYWQCLGAVIVLRQAIPLLKRPSDEHVMKDEPRTKI